MTRFDLKLLGRAVIEGPGGPLPGPVTQRSRLALLAVLALSPDGLSSRDRLMARLWPESDEKHARHALSNALHVVRKALGDDAVLSRGNDLQIDLARVRVDALDFEEAIERGEYEYAATLYLGPFLDGFHLDGAAEFERWADGQRDRLARAHDEALEQLASLCMATGKAKDAVKWLRRIMASDPFNTRVALRLMEALAAGGDRANAIEFGEEHAALLRSEFEMDAPPELQELMERLRVPVTGASAPGPGVPVTSPSATSPEAPAPDARELELPAFVGREAELARLHRRLEEAVAGQGQVLFITGEAGTGKTALAREFCRQACESHPEVAVGVGKGNAHTGVGDPYLPFREVLAGLTGDIESGGAVGWITRAHATRMLEALPRTGRILARDGPDLVGTLIAPEPLLDRVRGLATGEAWAHELARAARRRVGREPLAERADLFRQCVRVLHEVARERPLLLVLDDLQWADAGSVDLLFQLGRELGPSRILLLGLYRESEVELGRDGERHPLQSVHHELARRFGGIDIPLFETGDREFVDALLDLELNRFDAPFREAFFEQTRGHALFSVELLREMRDNGMLERGDDGRWVAASRIHWDILPARVEGMIGGRIDRLPQPLREALLAASVEGEEFTAEAIPSLGPLDSDSLIAALSGELEKRHHLVTASGVRRVGGRRLSRYRFRHVLFQKYLYDQLDAVERATLHEKVGRALENLYGDRADEEAVAMARHFEVAGLFDQAAHYRQKAGEQAMRAAANREAIAHFDSAIAALLTLPPSLERDRRELELQIALGFSRQASGAPGQGEAFTRGADLAGRLGDQGQLFWALAGLYLLRGHMEGDNRLGRELAERCLSIARDEGDTSLLVYALEFVGRNAMNRGQFRPMLTHYEELESLYDHERHHHEILYMGWDLGTVTRGMIAEAHWWLGYPDRAAELSLEALDLARRFEVPTTLPYALYTDVLIHMYRRDAPTARRQAGEFGRAVSELGQGFFEPYVLISLGWCDVQEGSIEAGIALMRNGWDGAVAMGWKVWFAYFTSLLSQAMGMAGRAEEGLAMLDEAHGAARTLEELVHEAEIRRIRGELMLALPDPDPAKAEAELRGAVEVARKQETRSYELRATTSLAKLLRAQGRIDEARTMLSEIRAWFTEGFDTVDLEEARTLLAELDD